MKHHGKAFRAALRILLISAILAFLLGVACRLIGLPLGLSVAVAGGLWGVFAVFTLYFFRDPEAKVPPGAGLVVAPAHGLVDAVEDFQENKVLGGRCQRISIFLSVFDVHVQQAPVGGRVCFVEHTPGKYLNAMNADSAAHNENVLIGFEPTDPANFPGGRMAVRLIAGLIARRILPWVEVGSVVSKGERVALIQFGSRGDIYLPPGVKITVKPGDRVVGGETVIARD